MLPFFTVDFDCSGFFPTKSAPERRMLLANAMTLAILETESHFWYRVRHMEFTMTRKGTNGFWVGYDVSYQSPRLDALFHKEEGQLTLETELEAFLRLAFLCQCRRGDTWGETCGTSVSREVFAQDL